MIQEPGSDYRHTVMTRRSTALVPKEKPVVEVEEIADINEIVNDNASNNSEYDSNILKPGTRITVRKQIDDEVVNRRAEIMSIRVLGGKPQFYVHFLEFNKRLDGWVGLDKMDMTSAEVKAEKSSTGSGAGSGSKSKLMSKASKNAVGRKKGVKRKLSVDDSMNSSQDSLLTDNSTATNTSTNNASSVSSGLEAEIESLRRGGSMTQRTEEISRVKNIDKIEMGEHLVEAWYFSPYPQELIDSAATCLKSGQTECIVYLCEFCLDNFGDRGQLERHRRDPGRCPISHPPGNEIYRSGNLSFFEIDGHKQKTYCRRLCLLSKLFLDHKTLFYDVDPFLFYILTENSARGSRILGYFSKEKESLEKYNLACILTLPQHQRKGFGRLLIEFSYELSKREGRIGSPEKPLSDLGLLSYRSFWSEVLVGILKANHEDASTAKQISIDQLSLQTSFTTDDILHTLQAIDALRYHRGQHIIVLSEKVIDDWQKLQKKIKCRIDPKCLQWTPPVFTPSQLRFL